jgi:hypothetical protein
LGGSFLFAPNTVIKKIVFRFGKSALITAAVAAIARERLSAIADKFGTESARSIARAAVLMDAAVAGLSALSVSGELAAAITTMPGSFRTALIDSIGGLTMPALRDRIKLSGAK